MQIYQILTDGLFRQNGTVLQGRRNHGVEEHGGWTKAPLHQEISGIFQPYSYFYWQYHHTFFAILIPKWCKYLFFVVNPIEETSGFILKLMKNCQMAPLVKYLTFKSKNQDISTNCTLPRVQGVKRTGRISKIQIWKFMALTFSQN